MRSASAWLEEYGVSHRNATNELLHCICVPAIVLSIIGLLWSLPTPAIFAHTSPWLNWATLTMLAALIYYFALAPRLAIGITLAFALMLWIVVQLAQLSWPLWLTSLAIFVVAWIGQFVGHSIEGTRPSFFKDIQFLLIGPLWLMSNLYNKVGLRHQ